MSQVVHVLLLLLALSAISHTVSLSAFYTSTPPRPPVTLSKIFPNGGALNSLVRDTVASVDADFTLQDANELISVGGVSWRSEGGGGSGTAEGEEEDDYYQQLLPLNLPASSAVRVHYPVRRFPSFPLCEVVHEDPSFIVVDKPAMLPSQPYKGNRWENVVGYWETGGKAPETMEEVQGVQSAISSLTSSSTYDTSDPLDVPLPRPHLLNRIDLPVSGLVVLGRTPRSRRTFSDLQKRNEVKKQYQCCSEHSIPTGVKKALLYTGGSGRDRGGQGVPGGDLGQVLCSAPKGGMSGEDGWSRCLMDVSRREELSVGGRVRYEYTINLLTGRKHQIRAVMSMLGAPLLNDTLYAPLKGLQVERVMEESEMGRLEQGLAGGRTVRTRIGLRAVAVAIGSTVVKSKGGNWWREEVA